MVIKEAESLLSAESWWRQIPSLSQPAKSFRDLYDLLLSCTTTTTIPSVRAKLLRIMNAFASAGSPCPWPWSSNCKINLRIDQTITSLFMVAHGATIVWRSILLVTYDT